MSLHRTTYFTLPSSSREDLTRLVTEHRLPGRFQEPFFGVTSEIAERSIVGQIEYWAQLGRAIEPLLQGAQTLALRRAGALKPLAECLESMARSTRCRVRAGTPADAE